MISFIDPRLGTRFERDGYVVAPLLEQGEIGALRRMFDDLAGTAVVGFEPSVAGRSADENARIGEAIVSIMGPAVDRVLTSHAPIGAAFLAKGPGAGGVLDVHQDWTSVDERVAWSVNVWCALTDVDLTAGCLEVAPGSHRWFETVRSPSLPSVSVAFARAAGRLTPVPVRAGDAVVYDHRLFHGSGANTGGALRLVAQVGVRPASAPLVMGFPGPPGEADLIEVTAAAYYAARQSPPDGSVRDPDASRPVGNVVPADVLVRLGSERSIR